MIIDSCTTGTNLHGCAYSVVYLLPTLFSNFEYISRHELRNILVSVSVCVCGCECVCVHVRLSAYMCLCVWGIMSDSPIEHILILFDNCF